MQLFKSGVLVLVILILLAAAASAQNPVDKKCSGPIYGPKDVAQRAKITRPIDFGPIYEAFGRDIKIHAMVEAVLCRSGRVTDIKVTEISPSEIKDLMAAVVSLIEFKPAEMNWHTVSQRQAFEFSVNDDSYLKKIDPAAATGREVESLHIVGLRTRTSEEILSWIKTRLGEPYDTAQIQNDFQTILGKGYFDKLTSRVITQEAIRGGVDVTFELFELPLIDEVIFTGANGIDTALLDTLRKHRIDLSKGAVFDELQMKTASHVIKEFLASRGIRNAKVEVLFDQKTGNRVTLRFKISSE